ncbi:hypothetical protein M9H77_35527 [Catharanthus roseus]|uniref:Uncharacterized protein n=1 Tax=Catharanthus roseus TaxID=4058 RepID=A0ACB9ZP87_CATRO|nr:hypothetical protein M9H77_35527 [Catharanthus roseus]
MEQDRSWMCRRCVLGVRGLSSEFVNGIHRFIDWCISTNHGKEHEIRNTFVVILSSILRLGSHHRETAKWDGPEYQAKCEQASKNKVDGRNNEGPSKHTVVLARLLNGKLQRCHFSSHLLNDRRLIVRSIARCKCCDGIETESQSQLLRQICDDILSEICHVLNIIAYKFQRDTCRYPFTRLNQHELLPHELDIWIVKAVETFIKGIFSSKFLIGNVNCLMIRTSALGYCRTLSVDSSSYRLLYPKSRLVIQGKIKEKGLVFVKTVDRNHLHRSPNNTRNVQKNCLAWTSECKVMPCQSFRFYGTNFLSRNAFGSLFR